MFPVRQPLNGYCVLWLSLRSDEMFTSGWGENTAERRGSDAWEDWPPEGWGGRGRMRYRWSYMSPGLNPHLDKSNMGEVLFVCVAFTCAFLQQHASSLFFLYISLSICNHFRVSELHNLHLHSDVLRSMLMLWNPVATETVLDFWRCREKKRKKTALTNNRLF